VNKLNKYSQFPPFPLTLDLPVNKLKEDAILQLILKWGVSPRGIRGKLTRDLFHGVDMSKRKIPVVLTESEQEDLLNQFNTRYVTSQRNKVIFGLMLNTGLRVSEATSLRWEDVNLQW